MSIYNKIIKYIKNPLLILLFLNSRGFLKWLPDDIYLKAAYRAFFSQKLNLHNPQTFNQKIQWLKLHDRNPLYTQLADKYEVREYIAGIIGEEYLIPMLGIWDKFDDIDFLSLPNQFVLKCTHDSGSVIICRDKNTFDIKAARKKINNFFKRNYYWGGREWQYKNIKPRIIAEKYMADDSGELKDYKFFCFDGKIKFIQVDYDRFSEHKRNLYTQDWQYINASIQYPTHPEFVIEKPRVLDEMLKIANKLAKGFTFIRIDLYCCPPPPPTKNVQRFISENSHSLREANLRNSNQIYFGEATFHPEAGFGKFSTNQFEVETGNWITLPEHNNKI